MPKLARTDIHLIMIDQHLYFNYILQGALEGLQENGFSVSLVKEADYFDLDSIFVTFLTGQFDIPLPKHYICYNWEQLLADDVWDRRFYTRLLGAVEVWDYSYANIAFLRTKGINAKLILPGYNRYMGTDLLPTEGSKKSIDIIFFGQRSSDRDKYFKIIRKITQNVKLESSGTPGSHSAFLMAAKIGLNIHYFKKGTNLEIHRIMQMIAHKTLVLSERSDDSLLDDLFSPMVTFFNNSEDMKDKIAEILALSEEEYNAEVTNRLDYFQKMPRFGENLRNTESILWKKG